jgi:quinol monooxygenase YgiN
MDYPPETTFHVRLSLMVPRPGKVDEVLELHCKLVEWLPGQPGFVRGYIISGDRWGRVGHLSVYTSEQDADHVAQTDHILAIRSELLRLIEEDSHVERSYTAHDPLAITKKSS